MEEKKTVFVCLLGRTNAGKSTLFNNMVGEKIAAVTHKPQTTRTQIRGIVTQGTLQYVFIDTPGLHKATTKFGQHMNKTARSGADAVDAAVFMLDCTKKLIPTEGQLLRELENAGTPVIFVLNKVDLLPDKTALLALITEYSTRFKLAAVLPISAKSRDDAQRVLKEARAFAVSSPFHFPEDAVTDQTEREIAAEIIRQHLMLQLHDEIPHGLAVTVERWKERRKTGESKEKILDISAVIVTEKQSHKGIIIGKKGETLRVIGSHARKHLEDFFQIKVNLKLWVSVKENWRANFVAND